MFTRNLGVKRERKGIRQKKLSEGRVKNLDETQKTVWLKLKVHRRTMRLPKYSLANSEDS